MYTEPFPFGKWVDWDLGRGSSAGSSRFPSGGMGTYTSYPIFSTGEDRLAGSWLALLVRFSHL